jgi:hypothetical protein
MSTRILILTVLAGAMPLLAELEPVQLLHRPDLPARKAVVGDFDGDGLNEIAVGRYCVSRQATVTLYRYDQGDLTYLGTIGYNAYSAFPLFADADNDGDLELIVSTDNSDSGGGVYIYDFTDWNSLTPRWSAGFSTIRRERGVSVGDVDNDGENELIIGVDWYGRRLYIYEYENGTWINSWSTGGNDFRSTCVVDTDNDGLNELLVGTGNWSWWDWRVYEGSGGAYSLQYDSGQLGFTTATAGDPDQDGLNEVIASSQYDWGGDNNLRLYRWSGSTYAELWQWNSGHYPLGAICGDLLGNGQHQIATFASDSLMRLFSFDGTSATEIWQSPNLGAGHLGECFIGDVDNDGANELLLAHYQSGLYIWDFRPDPGTVDAVDRPADFGLLGAWPNPFNPSTTLSWSLPQAGSVRLAVHDLLGREVSLLAEGLQSMGSHQTVWNPEGLPSGVYFARLVSEDGVSVRKLTLIR